MEKNEAYGYYPGCSLTRNAQAYNKSTLAIAQKLGLPLEELDDGNCCGATEYFALSAIPAFSLVARNLSIAERDGYEQMIAPCSACYINLFKTDDKMAHYADVSEKVNDALGAGGYHYDGGSVKVRHLLDVVVNDIGTDAIAEKVTKPLYNLRVAPYYGCLILRPYEAFDDAEYPHTLDDLMNAVGATVVDFPMKAKCCGGHMTQISEDVALELIRQILDNAAQYEADIIVTTCPMCQLNLDAYQANVNSRFGTDYNIPVLYFTQAIGLAMGMSAKELGFGQELVSAKPAIRKITEEAPKKARTRRDKKALPMPGAEK
jgi:heterodisulfide reductase subunit B